MERRRTLLSLALLAVVFTFPGSLSAQPGNPNDRVRGIEPGDPIPEVSGVGEDGKPFHLKDLKGSPSVIVFGCLT